MVGMVIKFEILQVAIEKKQDFQMMIPNIHEFHIINIMNII